MRKIRYLRTAPGAVRGEVRTLEARFADPLVRLGYAEYHNDVPRELPTLAPASAEVVAPSKKKRKYKRKDLKAES